MELHVSILSLVFINFMLGTSTATQDEESSSLMINSPLANVKRLHFAYNRRYPQLRRRLDRFRFFQRGLGKRSHEETYSPFVDSDVPGKPFTDNNDYLSSLMNKLTERDNQVPLENFVHSLTSILRGTKTFQDIDRQRMLTENFKRVPEIFSQELYPIQAGKQQMEVDLDRNLDNESDIMDAMESLDNVAYNDDSFENDDGFEGNPGDLIISGADLSFLNGNGNKYVTTESSEVVPEGTESESELTELPEVSSSRTKRWWALSNLRRLRSPQAQYRSRSLHRGLDPVLYILGLGR